MTNTLDSTYAMRLARGINSGGTHWPDEFIVQVWDLIRRQDITYLLNAGGKFLDIIPRDGCQSHISVKEPEIPGCTSACISLHPRLLISNNQINPSNASSLYKLFFRAKELFLRGDANSFPFLVHLAESITYDRQLVESLNALSREHNSPYSLLGLERVVEKKDPDLLPVEKVSAQLIIPYDSPPGIKEKVEKWENRHIYI